MRQAITMRLNRGVLDLRGVFTVDAFRCVRGDHRCFFHYYRNWVERPPPPPMKEFRKCGSCEEGLMARRIGDLRDLTIPSMHIVREG